MAKNVVSNAKTAAKNAGAAVLDVVKKAAGKGKPAKADPAPAAGVQAAKVTPTVKDTSNPSAGSTPKKKGGKKGKPVSLAVPRNEVDRRTAKGFNRAVSNATTAVNTLGRGSNRANVWGLSASSVWRALGHRKVKGQFVYTVADAKAFRDGLGLEGVISDTNVKCQFGDGRGRANGNDPLYGGGVAELTADQWKQVDKLAGK